jgi:iron complex transport system ATP-binding protein
MTNILKATNIAFAYARVPVLTNISLELEAGKITALIGPNGSGKSTLLRILLGDLRASGEILWRDKPISQWPRRELGRFIAYLPQNPRHEPGQTVLDVIRLGRAPYWGAFGLEGDSDQKIILEIADTLELKDLLDRSMDEISGGQRQRVFLGRCLAQQPAAVLLDEPHTFLDLKHQIEICQLLRRLSQTHNLSVLMASHDLNMVGAFSDEMILLHEGRMLAKGTPTQVLHPETLKAAYDVEMVLLKTPAGHPMVFPELLK